METQELLRIRKAMNVTQAQMADLLRVPLATIRKLEAGTLDPPISKKILRTLISLDFWLAKEADLDFWLAKEADKTKGGG